jgi:hypothetical protein
MMNAAGIAAAIVKLGPADVDVVVNGLQAPPAPPAPAEAPRTRYAIRHTDGRWLALAHTVGGITPVWVANPDDAWSWPYMTTAVCAALDVETGDLSAAGPWTVEPWPGKIAA